MICSLGDRGQVENQVENNVVTGTSNFDYGIVNKGTHGVTKGNWVDASPNDPPKQK